MTPLHATDRHGIATLGCDLCELLAKTLSDCSARITQTRSRIAQINKMKTRDASEERTEALRQTREHLHTCQQRYDQHKKEGHGLGWLLSPFDTYHASGELDQARHDHQQATLAYDEPATQAARDSQIAAHNQHVADQHAEKAKLNITLDTLTQFHRALSELSTQAAPALAAARGEGWLAADFGDKLMRIDRAIREAKFSVARECLAKLAFQRRPDAAVYARLHNQALDIRTRAYSRHHGVPITGSFPAIVEASAKLAAPNLKAACSDQLLGGLHSADQWQLLTTLAASPEHYAVDALWSIYWAMFQCQQKMADYLASAVAMEDPLNGRFSGYVEDALSGFAFQHIPLFGYPASQSYMGTLGLAGTPEESRLGADIGVIICLNIGGLVCRKAVLLQAKRAKDWAANIGSEKAQLPKLSKLPRAGYYLFYHESPDFRFDSPVPTVSSAQALQQLILDSKRQPDAASLHLDVRTTGCDWASFISFGLCNAASNVGEPFDTVDDAMRILGSGETGELPLRLFVVAIEDEPFAMALQLRVREQYQSAKKQLEVSKKKHKKDLDQDSPEFSL